MADYTLAYTGDELDKAIALASQNKLNLDTEILRAKSAEDIINNEITSLSTRLTIETNRAKAAENSLSQKLADNMMLLRTCGLDVSMVGDKELEIDITLFPDETVWVRTNSEHTGVGGTFGVGSDSGEIPDSPGEWAGCGPLDGPADTTLHIYNLVGNMDITVFIAR